MICEGSGRYLKKPDRRFSDDAETLSKALGHRSVAFTLDVYGHVSEEMSDNFADLVEDIPFDPKPFVPHITLGRKPVVPESVNLSGIMIPPAVMTVEDVFLYRSDRGENGMVYSVIGSSSEKGEAAR